MGTSSSRAGNHSNTGGNWTAAKRTTSRWVGGSGGSVGGAASAFARAARRGSGSGAGGGGGGGAVAVIGSALAGVIQSIAANGLEQTLRDEGLEHLIGRSPEEVLAGLSDHICGHGSGLDDAAARAALLDVIAEVFSDEETNSYEELQEAWDGEMDGANLVQLLELFLSQYIVEKFLSELGDCFDKPEVNSDIASQKERDVVDFIRSMVSLELGNLNVMQFDWKSSEAQAIIDRNLEAAMRQIEAINDED